MKRNDSLQDKINSGLMRKENKINSKLTQYQSFFWSPDYLDISAWMEHIPFAFWIIEVFKPKVVVELGVHNGTSYFSFCQAVKIMNIDTVCYGIDSWKGDEHAGFYGEEVFEKVISHNTKEFSRFSTLIRSTFDEAKEYFIDGSIDLLHIDGLHTYESVNQDFEKWLPKLSGNSLVIFHDINVRERNFGVYKLWEELKQKYHHFQFDFGHGLGILAMGKIVQSELKELFNENRNEDYYSFLRNIFSERGSFFKASFNNDLLIKQERSNLKALAETNAQLSERHKALEVQNAELGESRKTLEAQLANLNEITQKLDLQNAELGESRKILEALHLTNVQLVKTQKELVAKTEQLEMQNAKIELNRIQLQEKYQKDIAELSQQLKDAGECINDQSRKLSAIKQENELFRKNLNWYRETFEKRSLLGVLKEKIGSRIKKKINPDKTSGGINDNRNPEKANKELTSVKLGINNKVYYLYPANDIVLTDKNVYASTGTDPFFIAEFKNKKIKRGWYFLLIEVTEIKGILLGAKIYYDYGNGFNEKDIWNLPHVHENKIECLIRFTYDLERLRFDPSTIQCNFQIKKITLSPLNELKVLTKAIKKYGENLNTGSNYLKIYVQIAIDHLTGRKSGIKEKVLSSINGKGDYSLSAYAKWCALYDTLSENQLNIIRSLSRKLEKQPLFSIIMPVYNVPEQYLRKAIESVINQAYTNWEFCIADDRSTDINIKRVLEEFQSKDKRIKVFFRESNGGISKASNNALELASGDYMVLLDGDDELTPHSLYLVAKAINKNPKLELIYSDEDKIDERGNRFDPYFKTDWNKDLFYGHNMINHLGVYKLSLINKIGGFRPEFEGSQDYDLALRCIEHLKTDQIHHIPHVLYHWRALRGSAAFSLSNKESVIDAGLRALNDHLKRTEQNAVAEGNIRGSYRVKWSLPDPRPLVSIIIPTKDKVDILSNCITSILSKNSYENFEILIIDNNSQDYSTLEYLKTVQENHKPVKVFTYKSDFNFSAIVNYGVLRSKGEVIVLLNNDTEVINEDWLNEMVSQCMRVEIGVVGAKLFYPNGLIQHAGVFVSEGHPGIHVYLNRDKNDPGYFNKLNLVQNYSVVTAACLAIRKELFMKVGGFDEKNLKIAYNDVDFCLKVRELGYRNLWTPFAQLIHYESLSRGSDLEGVNYIRFKKEHSYMLKKWENVVSRDPFFNPNLGLDTQTNQYAFPPRVMYEWQDKEITKYD